jgi:hypothetical protein
MDSRILSVPSGSWWLIGKTYNPLNAFSVCLETGSKQEDFTGWHDLFLYYMRKNSTSLFFSLRTSLTGLQKYTSQPELMDLRVRIPRWLYSVIIMQLTSC